LILVLLPREWNTILKEFKDKNLKVGHHKQREESREGTPTRDEGQKDSRGESVGSSTRDDKGSREKRGERESGARHP
jgi:hypothetical protein